MRALAITAVAGAAAALLAGCGSSVGLIPADSAATLHDDLANIQLAFSTPDCTLAAAYVAKANDDFDNLPQSINAKLLTQLQHAMIAVASDEQRQCHNSTSTTGPTTGSSSETGPTGTTGTSSTTTSSTTSSSTSSSTTSSSTTSSTSTTGPSGITGSTCSSVTGVGGGTPACDGTTSSSGIGGAGSGGTGTDTGAASLGN
jgi:type II secretory pathway pseudopilin PulG